MRKIFEPLLFLNFKALGSRVFRKPLETLCFLSLLIGLLIPIRVEAIGTPAGTVIDSTPVTISFGTSVYELGASLSLTVEPIYGFTLQPATSSVTLNGFVTENALRTITNVGNTDVSINWQQIFVGTGYQYQYLKDDNLDNTWQVTENTLLTSPLWVTENQSLQFFIQLTPQGATADPLIVLQVSANGISDGGAYVGFNGNTYGGSDQVTGFVQLNILYDVTPPSVNAFKPGLYQTSVPINLPIEFDLIEIDTPAPPPSIAMIVNGVTVSTSLNISVTPNGFHIIYNPSPNWEYSDEIRVTINAIDGAGLSMPTFNSVFYTVSDETWPQVVSLNPTHNQQLVPTNTSIEIVLFDESPGVDFSSVRVWVQNQEVTASLNITGGPQTANVSFVPENPFTAFEYVTVQLVAKDLSGKAMPTYNYAFTISPNGTEGKLDITLFLEGYYQSGFQIPTTINVQLRPSRNINQGPIYTVPLDSLGNSGVFDVFPGTFNVVIWQKLSGLPDRVNHVGLATDQSYFFDSNTVVTLNFSVTSNVNYAPYYYPAGFDAPMKARGNVLILKGGNADGNAQINITDIVRWNNAASSPLSDQRGKPNFSEASNFDGNDFINTDDFSIWNSNRGQSIPLPEEE